jgi:hypothetical protein
VYECKEKGHRGHSERSLADVLTIFHYLPYLVAILKSGERETRSERKCEVGKKPSNFRIVSMRSSVESYFSFFTLCERTLKDSGMIGRPLTLRAAVVCSRYTERIRRMVNMLILPDSIAKVSSEGSAFDLRGLSVYSALSVSTLRDQVKSNGLSCYQLRGKILVLRSEFDAWITKFRVYRSQEVNL